MDRRLTDSGSGSGLGTCTIGITAVPPGNRPGGETTALSGRYGAGTLQCGRHHFGELDRVQGGPFS